MIISSSKFCFSHVAIIFFLLIVSQVGNSEAQSGTRSGVDEPWGYVCNVVNDPNSSTRRWGIDQYNLADSSAEADAVYSMPQNRKIQSVACDPFGRSILFSMKDSLRGDYELFELDVESRALTQITDNDTDDVDVTRSRDGLTVAWQKRLEDNRQAIELRRTGEGGLYTYKTLASANPFVQPSLSANGEWMTFVQLRPNFFTVMRYDINNNKYDEVKSIARRKKLYHPSITDDGNLVGWSERVSQRRYRVKNMTDNTITGIVNNSDGVEHAVLTSDGQYVMYSVNSASHASIQLTSLESLETTTVSSTLSKPIRYLSTSWSGAVDSSYTHPTSHTEYVTAYADRPLRVPITDVPFDIDWGVVTIESDDLITTQGASARLAQDSNEFYFIASNGFTGKRTVTFELHDNSDPYYVDYRQRPAFYKTYIVDVLPPPLEGNRDFMLTYLCDYESHGQASNVDIDIVNDDLSTRISLYQGRSYSGGLPNYYSRVEIDYLQKDNDESQLHHTVFKNNLDAHLLITCEYASGNKSFIFPIDSPLWYADQVNVGNGSSRTFVRNDIFIYVSSLSDLHSKIYKKYYEHSFNSKIAYEKANEFMNYNFPSSHYSSTLAKNYDSNPENPFFYSESGIADDNKKYYGTLELMAEETGIDNVHKLIDAIANNYESYYLSDIPSCTNEWVCATFFPEHTTSTTNDPRFESGLSNWVVENTTAAAAFSEIKTSNTEDSIVLELRANTASDDPISHLEVYQTTYLNELQSIDDYYLDFDLRNLVGTSTGFSFAACINSSGLTGVFASLHDSNGNQIGLLTWTDHCNKFDAAWVSGNIFESTDVFHNTRMRDVIRRFTPAKEFTFTASLGQMLSSHLPQVHEIRSSISSIRYGVFATEHRSYNNTCYYCDTELEAKEINLLRKN